MILTKGNTKRTSCFIVIEINEKLENYKKIKDKVIQFMCEEECYEYDEGYSIDDITTMIFILERSSEIEHILTAQRMYKKIPEVFPYLSSFRMTRKVEVITNTNLMFAVGE